MKNIKKEKAFWKKYFNLPDKLEEIPAAIEHINLRCTEVDDEELEYLVSRIKVIDRLDLDETQIPALVRVPTNPSLRSTLHKSRPNPIQNTR